MFDLYDHREALRPFKTTLIKKHLLIRDWSLITGREGLQNGRGGGGAREVLPLQKGGAEKVLAMLNGGGAHKVLG